MERAIANKRVGRWYERQHWAYAADLKTVEAYASWLRMVSWTFFATFTFAWKVSGQQAEAIFDEFINRLERLLRTDVGYVRGDEKRISGCGKAPSGPHFHALLISSSSLDPVFVEWLWMSMAGNQSGGAGALVEAYDPADNGAKYVLKFLTKAEGNWAFRNLELFHPEARNLQRVTKRLRRHLRRHKSRQQKQGQIK